MKLFSTTLLHFINISKLSLFRTSAHRFEAVPCYIPAGICLFPIRTSVWDFFLMVLNLFYKL